MRIYTLFPSYTHIVWLYGIIQILYSGLFDLIMVRDLEDCKKSIGTAW